MAHEPLFAIYKEWYFIVFLALDRPWVGGMPRRPSPRSRSPSFDEASLPSTEDYRSEDPPSSGEYELRPLGSSSFGIWHFSA